VARYWPEFAAGGKDKVTVRQAMTHRAGVPGYDPPITPDTVLDWDASCANIAAQSHWFGGDDKISYHPSTYGFLLGEIMRRTDGRKPAQFVREEIAERGGIDLQIGVSSRKELDRIAHFKYPPMPPPDAQPPFNAEGMRINMSSGGTAAPSWARMSADISAGNGYTNARAMAQLTSIFACGGELEGERYLSKSVVDEALSLQATGEDWLFGPVNMCLGFNLDSNSFPAPTPTTVHWGGAGGSQLCMDPRTGVGYGFAMNQIRMGHGPEDTRFMRLWQALSETMGAL
jgi:CubicO group peptidase (beta-lactamase class C family)